MNTFQQRQKVGYILDAFKRTLIHYIYMCLILRYNMKISRRWHDVLYKYRLAPCNITYDDYTVGYLNISRHNEIKGYIKYADGIFALQRSSGTLAYILLYDYRIIQIFSYQRNTLDWVHPNRTPFYVDSSFMLPHSLHTSSAQSCVQNVSNNEQRPSYFSFSSRNTFSRR